MRRPRIVFIDTYYPEAMAAVERRPEASYAGVLRQLLDLRFGTADFVSSAMRRAGWDASDVVANSKALANRFLVESQPARKGQLSDLDYSLALIASYGPDVVAVQNVSVLPRDALIRLRDLGITLALFASYAMAADAPVDAYDVLFTSFPHYQELYGSRVRVVVLPLAFAPEATAGLDLPPRDLPVTFVGGLGHRSIWNRGQDALELLARNVPEFAWWGYGESELAAGSRLRAAWRGRAWGIDMYRVYLRSKIVVNRHGEIARGYANNMRLYEATGSGALLVTERAPNLGDLFKVGDEVAAYSDPEDLVATVRRYLADEPARMKIAAAGQAATLSRHTFDERAALMDMVLRPIVLSRRTI